MGINVNYYGAESTWLDFKPVSSMEDDFKVPQFSGVSHSTYGLSSRTWPATKYGGDYDSYKAPLDATFCWCGTDGQAPFDNVFGVTGYNNNHDRYEANQNAKNSIGLGTKGNQSAYITSAYAQYYKASASGGAEWGSVPMNFQPDYSFSPQTDSYTGGLKIMRLAQGGLAPALKFDFGNYFMTPYVHYYVLKNTATLSDWNAVTDPRNYSGLVDSTKRDDLYTFVKRINDNTYSADKIVIYAVTAYITHVIWNADKTYDISTTNVSFGSQSTTSGLLQGFTIPDTPVKLTFSDWYDTTDPQQYMIDIDTTFLNNRGFAVNTVGIYNGKAEQIVSGQYNSQCSIVLAGCPDTYATGYSSPTSYPYYYQVMSKDVSKFHMKQYSADSDLPNAARYGYSFHAQLSDFGGLNGFREYVRKACAYFGMYFTEMAYPDTTKDWLTEDAFIGTIDSQGITHGAYTQGADNANQPQRTWGNDWASKTPYKPGNQPKPTAPDHEDPSDPLNLRARAYIGAELGPRRYVVKPDDVIALFTFIKNCTDYNNAFEGYADVRTASVPAEDLDTVKAISLRDWQNTYPDTGSWYSYVYDVMGDGVHPNNKIIGLMAFPFYLRDKFGNVDVGIQLGDINTNYSASDKFFTTKSWYQNEGEAIGSVSVQFNPHTLTAAISARPVTGEGIITLDLGSKTIEAKFGDFRDYMPYSHIELQVPYHGSFELDPADWIGHTVSVVVLCEVITGSSLAIVCRDGAPIATAAGQMGFSVPLNIDTFGGTTASFAEASAGLQNAQVEHRVHAVNGAIDVAKSSAKTIAAGAFTVATGGAGAGALALAAADTAQTAANLYGQMKTEKNSIKAAEYSMEHNQTGSSIIGGGSPSCAAKYETRCRLVWHYCRQNFNINEAAYGATQGFSCNVSGKVSDFGGYSVFSNVVLQGIGATSEEKAEIVKRMQEGVIV